MSHVVKHIFYSNEKLLVHMQLLLFMPVKSSVSHIFLKMFCFLSAQHKMFLRHSSRHWFSLRAMQLMSCSGSLVIFNKPVVAGATLNSSGFRISIAASG